MLGFIKKIVTGSLASLATGLDTLSFPKKVGLAT